MHRKNKSILFLFLVIVFLGGVCFLKFYTAVVSHVDDPTLALIIKHSPSMSNSYKLTHEQQFIDYIIIVIDENEFIGEELYDLLTGWLWIPLVIIFLLLIIYLSTKLALMNKGDGVNLP